MYEDYKTHTKNRCPYQPKVIKFLLKIPSGLFQFSHSSPELHKKNCPECPILISSDTESENEMQQEAQEVEQEDINTKSTKARMEIDRLETKKIKNHKKRDNPGSTVLYLIAHGKLARQNM